MATQQIKEQGGPMVPKRRQQRRNQFVLRQSCHWGPSPIIPVTPVYPWKTLDFTGDLDGCRVILPHQVVSQQISKSKNDFIPPSPPPLTPHDLDRVNGSFKAIKVINFPHLITYARYTYLKRELHWEQPLIQLHISTLILHSSKAYLWNPLFNAMPWLNFLNAIHNTRM